MCATSDQLPLRIGSERAGFRNVDWGALHLAVVTMPAGADATAQLQGLPGNRSPCPLWGHLPWGQPRVSTDEGEEMIRTGELFYGSF